MKTTTHEREELRDAEIATLARAKFQAARDAILAGDQRATTDACNSLQDFLANAVLPDLVRTAFATGSDVTGKAFTDILVAVMQADAELAATREVDHAIAQLQQDQREAAIGRHENDREMARAA
jgi:hypothetical protein